MQRNICPGWLGEKKLALLSRSLTNQKCDSLPEQTKLFTSFADANDAGPSLTFTLVFFRSALFCLLFYFFFCLFCLFSFCANKVGFTKADLQGRRSNSASSEASFAWKSAVCNALWVSPWQLCPLSLPQRLLALWEKRDLNVLREAGRGRLQADTSVIKQAKKKTSFCVWFYTN